MPPVEIEAIPVLTRSPNTLKPFSRKTCDIKGKELPRLIALKVEVRQPDPRATVPPMGSELSKLRSYRENRDAFIPTSENWEIAMKTVVSLNENRGKV